MQQHVSIPRRLFRWFRTPRGIPGIILRGILLAFFLFCADIGRYLIWPPVGRFTNANPETSSFMEYRLAEARRAGEDLVIRHTWKDMRYISRNLQLAVTIAEDDLFWDHSGFDFESIKKALRDNLEQGRIAAGGSTITQQLAKNLFFTPDRSVVRKAKEAIMTWRLENALEKERILEIYLNVVEWGPGIFGAEAASRAYFKKSAANLSVRESAILAAILPNPLGRTPNSAIVQRKANFLERAMKRRGAS